MAEEPKHLEKVLRRQARERFETYDLPKVFENFLKQERPISDVKLAMILKVSTVISRDVIARLSTKQLIVKDRQDNWRVKSEPKILKLLRGKDEGLTPKAIALELDLTEKLVKYELGLMRQKELVFGGKAWKLVKGK